MAMRDIPAEAVRTRAEEIFGRARDLHAAAIFVTPRWRSADWADGYGESWYCVQAARCDECGHAQAPVDGEAECEKCGGYLFAQGPMSSYWWPLPEYRGDEEEDARRLVDLPVCIVRFPDDYPAHGLAFTACGMDLSWELCEAYARLGYLPPFHLVGHLPNLAGSHLDERRRRVLAACNRTVSVLQWRAASARRALKNNREALRRLDTTETTEGAK